MSYDDDTTDPDERRAAELVGQQICARCGMWIPLELGNRFECDYPYGHPPPGSRSAAERRARALRRGRIRDGVIGVAFLAAAFALALWALCALFSEPDPPVRVSPVSGAS